jgi:GntR family transcriptional regulator/MocR family aminotransferase
LRDAVREGRLQAGVRLPSSRSLAADLGVARNTVAEAYAQLVAEGWLEARQGSGTSVGHVPLATGADPPPRSTSVAFRYDLQPGSPDLSSFPRHAWLAAARRVLAETPDDLFGYGDPRGVAPLREALSAYLSRVRGVRSSPDRVVVCAGYTQALGLVCRALAESGARRVAVEGYGLSANWEVIAAAGIRAVAVQVDGEGADLGGVEADAAVVTPAHQFPLGSVMSPQRRSTVVEWARDSEGVVVEDDYDGEFRFDRQPVGALQSLAPDYVVYAGTASKTLAPGVRVGWLVLPEGLVEPVVAQKAAADRQSGVIDQLVLAQLISSGRYDRHVRRRRLAYRARRDMLVEAVERAAPKSEILGISAGLHALVTLPDGIDERAAVASGARRGLGLQSLSGHRFPGAPGPEWAGALVIGYATPPDHAYPGALDRLCEVLRTDRPGPDVGAPRVTA